MYTAVFTQRNDPLHNYIALFYAYIDVTPHPFFLLFTFLGEKLKKKMCPPTFLHRATPLIEISNIREVCSLEIVQTIGCLRKALHTFTNFTNLSTATSDPNFDQNYKVQIDSDIINIEKLAAEETESSKELDLESLFETINQMKNWKSPDGEGIMAEHLKFGGTLLLQYLQKLF